MGMKRFLLGGCQFRWLGLAQLATSLATAAVLAFAIAPTVASALAGDLRVHDPSTVVECDGRYYVFSTGPGIPILSSDDGFTWTRSGHVFDKVPDSVHAAVPLNDGKLVWAPDVIKLNGEYYLYYSISKWGSNVSAVGLLTNPTLNDKYPKYKWTDRGLVVNSVAGESLNAIDPGVLHGPDGRLWLTYGSYIGNVQMVELDPRTGLRIAKDSPATILSSASEASDAIFHNGYYYLFVNRGSCCKGTASTYNIRMGRSRTPTGPYLDRYGVDMAHGGGSLFAASQGNHIGPGHFGLVAMDGVEKFSCHYEGNLATGGRGELAIHPLLWGADGWPSAGEDVKDGTYQMQSKRLGDVLEFGSTSATAPDRLHLGRYASTGNQKWEFAAAGGGYYKIIESGTANALEASAPQASTVAGAVGLAPYTGADSQLWKMDELSDGSYRVEAKTSRLALAAATRSAGHDTTPAGVAPAGPVPASLKPYTGDDAQRWFLLAP